MLKALKYYKKEHRSLFYKILIFFWERDPGKSLSRLGTHCQRIFCLVICGYGTTPFTPLLLSNRQEMC